MCVAIVTVVGCLNPLANGESSELKGMKLLSGMAAPDFVKKG